MIFPQISPPVLEKAKRLEWLETNGLGGWASSTVSGINTRRYHGLLVAATAPPVGRMVMLSKLEETIRIGEETFELGCNQFPGAVHPYGYQFLQSFRKEFFPIFDYKCNGIALRKTVAAVHGENTVLVMYEVLQSPHEFSIDWRPFLAAREFHSLMHRNDSLNETADFSNGILHMKPYEHAPSIFISAPRSVFVNTPDWYYNFEYEAERERGLDYREDLFTPGFIRVSVKSGDRVGIIISTENPAKRIAGNLLEKESDRRHRLLEAFSSADEVARTLVLAADQFVVSRGESHRSIIAGYHWFSDWGRDTMISLPGLCLTTGRYDDAKKILRAFAQHVDKGMLPNRFPDQGEPPEYNTVDATLHFFISVYRYFLYTKDERFVRDALLPVLQEIIAWHDRGTRYNIHVSDDGLLCAGERGVQLTWMDAKIGDWVVTPRSGKPVEVNALWYNALMIMAELSGQFGHEENAQMYKARAEQVREAFCRVYWNEEKECLYDVVDGQKRDPSIRPNQIFAISLPFKLLDQAKAQKVIRIVESKLYTPYGLRSLAPDEPGYRARYTGNQFDRDSAYHQGIAWSWLLGPLISAIVYVEGEAGKPRARQIVDRVIPNLFEANIGSISEIFDAEEPFEPRGCIAQAWSVAEILRALMEDIQGVVPTIETKQVAF